MIDEKIEEFANRAFNQLFRNAVRTTMDEAEATLPQAVKRLAEWVGRQCWKKGYDVESFKTFMNAFDWGGKLDIGVTVDAKKVPATLRQFAQQFIELAEAAKGQLEHERARYKELEDKYDNLVPEIEEMHELPARDVLNILSW